MPLNNSLPELRDIFETLRKSSYQGVQGVLVIESGNPGPVLGVTACTHGNEPTGLAVFKYLLEEKHIHGSLKSGRLYLVVNNIAATERFFAAATDEEIRKARYVDVNMNRLPKDVLSRAGDVRSEIVRTRELHAIWEQFTVGIDIHSTTSPTEPLLLSRGKSFQTVKNLVKGFPIDTLISNIDQVQLGVPAMKLYGAADTEIPVFAIEAGQHTQSSTFLRATDCVINLLLNTEMIEGVSSKRQSAYKEYLITDSIFFPDESYDLVQKFRSYEKILAGQVLARNIKGSEIRALHDGHLIMPTEYRGLQKDITEEVAFISQPVVIQHRQG